MMGAPKFAVKLTSTYAHDVQAMVAATPKAGRVLHRESEQPDGNDDSEGRHRVAAEEQAQGLGGDRRRGVSPLFQ